MKSLRNVCTSFSSPRNQLRQSLGKVERDGKTEAQMEEALNSERNEFSVITTRVLSKRNRLPLS